MSKLQGPVECSFAGRPTTSLAEMGLARGGGGHGSPLPAPVSPAAVTAAVYGEAGGGATTSASKAPGLAPLCESCGQRPADVRDVLGQYTEDCYLVCCSCLNGGRTWL